jgi:hypothetical protein
MVFNKFTFQDIQAERREDLRFGNGTEETGAKRE